MHLEIWGVNRGSPWTEGRVEELKKLAAEGKSAGEIAVALNCGITRNAVIGKMFRHRIALKAAQEHRKHRVKSPDDQKPLIANLLRRKPPTKSFVPKIPLGEPAPLRISILDLKSMQCRNPIGETDDDCLPLYCGHQTQPDSSWCDFHRARFTYRVAR